MKRYYIATFGCQTNVADSERIASALESAGLKKSVKRDTADVLVLNTCSIRQKAEDRVFGLKREIDKLKAKNRKLKTVLTGCMMHYDKKELGRRLPFIDIFIDIKDICKLPKLLGLKKSAQKRLKKDYLNLEPKYTSKISAGVPISYGCDNFCTYCIVPYSRNREYSRPVEDIVKEVQNLVGKGYKEIWLLGQNVNSYCHKINCGCTKKLASASHAFICNKLCPTANPRGAEASFLTAACPNNDSEASEFFNRRCGRAPERSEGRDKRLKNSACGGITKGMANAFEIKFPDLLRIINSIPGDFWIRFTSPHPKDFSDDLIKAMAECEKFAHYINLPIQSGDNTILKKMNRPYTAGHYKKLVAKMRKTIPDIAVSTDIIVGFPGETKKQFENTAKLMREIGFDMAYLSEYSPRPGTAAAKTMKDDVPHKEKERRKEVLNNILEKSALKNNKKLVGKTLRVLDGKTEGHKSVKISGKYPKDKFIDVKITGAGAWGLKGEVAG